MSYDLCFLDYIIDYGHGPVRVTEPVVPHECLNAALARRFGLKQNAAPTRPLMGIRRR